MRFDSVAYDKVFPREEETTVIESAVETFKPSENDSIVEVEQEGNVDDGTDDNDDSE